MPFLIPFLASGPKLKVTKSSLKANTGLFVRVITLFSYGRWITIDSISRVVKIKSQYFWFFIRFRSVHFSNISCIYSEFYESGSSSAYLSGKREGREKIEVYLRLKNGKSVFLVCFSGQGAFVADVEYPNEWLENRREELLDVAGDQVEQSQFYIDSACRLIQVPYGI